jgi:hypothetical protein
VCAQEFNATVEFYWAPFLVESNSDDPKIHSIQQRIIKADEIAKHAENWRGVDYLVFNTYIWWMNTFNMKVMYVRCAPFRLLFQLQLAVCNPRGQKENESSDRKATLSFFFLLAELLAGDRAGRAGRITTTWFASRRTGRC